MFRIVLMWLVIICKWELTTETKSPELSQVQEEHDLDCRCLDDDIDLLGVNSTAVMHSIFTSTKVESLIMGMKFRPKLLKLINLIEKKKKTDDNPVSASCGPSPIQCDCEASFRTADGSCNNLDHPEWGKSFIPMRRFIDSEYDDRMSSPRTKGKNGKNLKSARKISTTLHTLDSDSTENAATTHMAMQFGQFLDHDITSTPIQRGAFGSTVTCCREDIRLPNTSPYLSDILKRPQCFPIKVPRGDQRFKRFNRTCMNFVRSVQVANAHCNSVPVEQMNEITAFIDASQVYGSTDKEQHELRTFKGGSLKEIKLKNNQTLLPEDSSPDCATSSVCFKAGDNRVNEQMGLTSMQTIFLREHNRIVGRLEEINPHWGDERLFQEVRKIVGAMLQHITYNEYLPLVLSLDHRKENNLVLVENNKYSNVYNANADPSIRNAFATAAFRFGHSMVRSFFSHANKRFKSSSILRLRDSFGNTSIITSSAGDAINTLTRGLLVDPSQSVDRHCSLELRDHLFEDENENSFDLIALNIQRGRDHGLPGYNRWREWCGLPKASGFSVKEKGLVNHTKDVAKTLKSLYNSPDDIDLFSGGLSEKPVPGALIGPTFSCIIARQFEALRVGDRFWYETGGENEKFPEDQLEQIRNSSLARVICDNTKTTRIQKLVFRAANKKSNPLTPCSKIPQIDLEKWREIKKGMWTNWSPWSKCKGKKMIRKRKCQSRKSRCPGKKKEIRPCNCQWNEWSQWGRCVKGCQYSIRVYSCETFKKENFRKLKMKSCGNKKAVDKTKCRKLSKYLKWELYFYNDVNTG